MEDFEAGGPSHPQALTTGSPLQPAALDEQGEGSAAELHAPESALWQAGFLLKTHSMNSET